MRLRWTGLACTLALVAGCNPNIFPASAVATVGPFDLDMRVLDLQAELSDEGRPSRRRYVSGDLVVTVTAQHYLDTDDCGLDCPKGLSVQVGDDPVRQVLTQPGGQASVQILLAGVFDDCPRRDACEIQTDVVLERIGPDLVEATVRAEAIVVSQGRRPALANADVDVFMD